MNKIALLFGFLVALSAAGEITLLQLADTERPTADAYLPEVERYIQLHPEVDAIVHLGDINGAKGIASLAEAIRTNACSRPILPVIGNHDIVAGNPYYAAFGSYWGARLIKGHLIITAPMYASWGTALPYNMLDFGDWLAALLPKYPDTPKVMIAHDPPDIVGKVVATRNGNINLDDHHINILYGHKHMNIATRYANGRVSLCTACSTMSGCGGFYPCFRVTTFGTNGSVQSTIHPMGVTNLLTAVASANTLSVIAFNSIDEVTNVQARIAETAIPLKRCNLWAWEGTVPTAFEKCTLEAQLQSGKTLSRTLAPTRCESLTTLSQETAIADPLLINGLIVAAAADDADSLEGGLFALDAKTLAIRWRTKTCYSIRNNPVSDGQRVYAIDVRGHLHAFAADTGAELWKNVASSDILSPSASALCVTNGTVVGGYGALLRGVDASTGGTIWTNTAWVERTPDTDKLTTDGTNVWVVSQLNGLYRHNLRTGAVTWRNARTYYSATPLVTGTNLYIKGERGFYRLDARTGDDRTELTYPILPGDSYVKFNSAAVPISCKGSILAGTVNAGLLALDPVSLALKWRHATQRAIIDTTAYTDVNDKCQTIDSTLLAVGERLFFGANDGYLYTLEAQTGKLISKYDLGFPIRSRVVWNHNRITVIDMAGRVITLVPPEAPPSPNSVRFDIRQSALQ